MLRFSETETIKHANDAKIVFKRPRMLAIFCTNSYKAMMHCVATLKLGCRGLRAVPSAQQTEHVGTKPSACQTTATGTHRALAHANKRAKEDWLSISSKCSPRRICKSSAVQAPAVRKGALHYRRYHSK